jgi:hypothetical protein
MTKPEDQHNAEIMQRRGYHPAEAEGHGGGREPYPNEIIGLNEPPYHPIGVDALSPILLHVEFPATKEEIARKIGDARIAVSQNETRRIADILAFLGPETFQTSKDVERAAENAWDQIADLQGRGGRHWQGDMTHHRRRE